MDLPPQVPASPAVSPPPTVASSPLNKAQAHSAGYWHQRLREYAVAGSVAVVQFVVFSVYLYGRRGYYNLFISNKIFAGIAVVTLGIVLLLGPLSYMFQVFDRWLRYRKELGIVAFWFALAHSLSSLFFLPDRFPLQRYLTTGKWPFLFGLLAILVLVVIYVVSNDTAMKRLTTPRWWRIQRWGVRVAFIAVALHVGIMKFPGWLDWYNKGGSSELVHPEWPGLGLLVAWFMTFVLAVRAALAINAKLGKFVWYASVILLPLVYLTTFWWGSRFAS